MIEEVFYNEMNEECPPNDGEDDELYEKHTQERLLQETDEQRLEILVEELQNNGFEYEKRVEVNTEDYVFLCCRYQLYIQYDDECLIELPINDYLYTSILEYFENEHYGFSLSA